MCLAFGLLGIPWRILLIVLPLQGIMPSMGKEKEGKVPSSVEEYMNELQAEMDKAKIKPLHLA